MSIVCVLDTIYRCFRATENTKIILINNKDQQKNIWFRIHILLLLWCTLFTIFLYYIKCAYSSVAIFQSLLIYLYQYNIRIVLLIKKNIYFYYNQNSFFAIFLLLVLNRMIKTSDIQMFFESQCHSSAKNFSLPQALHAQCNKTYIMYSHMSTK